MLSWYQHSSKTNKDWTALIHARFPQAEQQAHDHPGCRAGQGDWREDDHVQDEQVPRVFFLLHERTWASGIRPRSVVLHAAISYDLG